MAHEPCSACGRPFFGRSVLAYPTMLDGTERLAKRVRLDRECTRAYLANLEQYFDGADDGPVKWGQVRECCHFCGTAELHEGTRWLFCTIYPTRNERRDFASIACDDCAVRAAKEVLLDAS